MNYTLGLDMGVASLGWAVISVEDQFINSGVRIFPAGIDKFGTGKDTHLNQERRSARTARRRGHRKAKRKQLIRKILSDLGWMPENFQEWENLNVYHLRSKALSEKVTLPELARIILHLNQRRGFLSLRKSEVDAAEGEDKEKLVGMLGQMDDLQSQINQTFDEPRLRTLGNYLHHICEQYGGEHRNEVRLRARHIRRDMLHHEFSLIWAEQSKYHTELTDALRYGTHGKQKNPTAVTKPIQREKNQTLLSQFGLENLTFFQRRVYWPTSSIGKCELEEGELRAPIADRRFQEFRMLSELNNLRIFDHSTEGKPQERKLTEAERDETLSYLSTTQKPTLKGLKSKIGKLANSPKANQITFNLEQDKRDNIGGLPTELKIAKAFGENCWKNLAENQKNKIVEILTMPEPGATKVIQRTDDETKELLKEVPNLVEEQIEALLRISLPSGYCNFSVKALEKLLPHIRNGMTYQAKDEKDSAMHLAGYKRRDEFSHKTLNKLPHLSELNNPKAQSYDRHFPHVNNPLVLRALHELRKVINGVISQHGKPTHIHLEMARDLSMSTKQREEYAKKNNEHKKARELAATKLEENGIAPTRDAILLYRLWEEQGKLCIYSGRPISFEQLISGSVDIDHIYPRRANDDSYMNKVVCFRQENAAKGDRFPSEWLGEGSDKFEDMAQRAQSLPYAKRKRLLADKIPEGFANRDATDTAYMTKVARHYLTYLVANEHDVLCTKGKHTSFLRKQWGLNGLLRNDLLDLKNREDHRHHALDAIVIAACGRQLLQKISKELTFENKWKDKTNAEGKAVRIYRLKSTAKSIKTPWEHFTADTEVSLNSIWVSHRANRKVSGPLHEETNYGSTSENGVLVRRKKICDLKETELKKIRDPEVAKAVTQYLEREKHLYHADIGGKSFKEEIGELFAQKSFLTQGDIDQIEDHKLRKTLTTTLKKKNPLQDAEYGKITLPSKDGKPGTPIKKARLLVPNKAAVVLRERQPKELIIPGNTHHMTIFSLGDGKYHFEPVTLLEASRRKRAKQSIVKKTPPAQYPSAEFVMSLSSKDSILCKIDGENQLFVFITMNSSSGQVWFALHSEGAAGHKNSDTGKDLRRSCRPGTFEKNFPQARKVEVLPNGELRSV